jgi:hypothetical protein
MTDDEWACFEPFLIHRGRGRPPRNHGRVLDAVFWLMRTGAPWRDLPEEFGNWNSIFRQFRRLGGRRWRRMGDDAQLDVEGGISVLQPQRLPIGGGSLRELSRIAVGLLLEQYQCGRRARGLKLQVLTQGLEWELARRLTLKELPAPWAGSDGPCRRVHWPPISDAQVTRVHIGQACPLAIPAKANPANAG